MKKNMRIGIDTGGTFTDLTFFDKGRFQSLKLPSTPRNPDQAIVEGMAELSGTSSCGSVIHGTTVATNALLERKGGRIALITTRGFEDVLAIGRQTRQQLYSLQGTRKHDLVPRKYCFGVEERTQTGGMVVREPTQDEVEKLIDRLRSIKAQAVALCLLHSYIQPKNEIFIQSRLEKEGFLVSSSCQILPEYREYERMAVTAVNAYIMPVMSQYLARLQEKLKGVDLKIMQSNEGHISPETAGRQPVRTVLSGPAGGVVAAARISRVSGFKKIISFDMGGTSSDVSLVDGKISKTHESVIGGFPLRLPIIDIHTVGAGGGSIAYVDEGGSLRVGPRSAGADPGPSCYGKALFPTVTDANLVLGRLVPEYFLGGRMPLFQDMSFRSIGPLSKQIERSIDETAQGILTIANANMEKALRVISVERGYDPRDFFLFSFGGAGGLHAVDIARRMKMKGVIVPPQAGVLSAKGLLLADSVKDFTKSILKPVNEINEEHLEDCFSDLQDKAFSEMKAERLSPSQLRFIRAIDLRYMGQSYELTLPFSSLPNALPSFHRQHKKIYSYCHVSREVEIVNIRIQAVGVGKRIRLKREKLESPDPKKAFLKEQMVFFEGKTFATPVFSRSSLRPGNRICGPALTVDQGSTILIPPDCAGRIDPYLNMIIKGMKKW